MRIEEVGMTKSEKYEYGKTLKVFIEHENMTEWTRENLRESLEATIVCRNKRALGEDVAYFVTGNRDEDLAIFDEVIRAYRIVLTEYSIEGETARDIISERDSEKD